MSARPALGLRGLSYLRALTEGLSVEAAAERFLGIEGGALRLREAHRAIVDEVRTLARRRGDPAWRLIGIELGSPARRTPVAIPSIDEWAEAEGLNDWRLEDLLETYEARFAVAAEDATQARRRQRNERLRVRRLELLRQLELAGVSEPRPTDALDGWIDPILAERLRKGGLITLADVERRHASGERWWRELPAVGEAKARAIAEQVGRLLVRRADRTPVPLDWGRALASSSEPTASRIDSSGEPPLTRRDTEPATAGCSDRSAVGAWVAQRAKSEATRKQYTREAERFLLWARLVAQRPLAGLTGYDCRRYVDFLSAIPDRWISRRKVEPLAPGWAPFAGQLSDASRRLTLHIVGSMFQWLTDAGHLPHNPWTGVDRMPASERKPKAAVRRAFTPEAWSALLNELDRPPNRQVSREALERLRWLCTVGEATGLRPGELLRAQRGDVRLSADGAVLHVVGRGQGGRQVPMSDTAVAASRRYFASRRLDWESAPAATPLLASLTEPDRPPRYDALHETFTRFVRRALKSSGLPETVKEQTAGASAHWLRHTHGTRVGEGRGGEGK